MGVVNTDEPFRRLVNQGMILGEGGVKMSKSLGNVINPDDIVGEYGADAMRLYEMFMGPLEVAKPWSTRGIVGVKRFLDRVWRVGQRPQSDTEPFPEKLKLLHQTIKKVSEDTGDMEFNTAISQMMVFINGIYSLDEIPKTLWHPFVRLLAVYAPHLGEELWEMLGNESSVSSAEWPVWDEAMLREETVTVVCQVNGKVRGRLEVPAGTSAEDLEKQALAQENIKRHTDGKRIVKVIAIPDKLVNIVVG